MDLSFAAPPTWIRDAPCASIDPGIFFPDKGESPRPAKRICAGCPVRARCLEWAMSQDVNVAGIWGGTSELERRRMRKAAA